MLSSPAKRRKTSETTAAAIDASQTNQQAHENNNRVHQRRPSFQSPTKASLARSHLNVLARALSPTRPARNGSNNGQEQEREQAESRTFGLRDRKALRPSLASNASPIHGSQLSPRRQSGLAAFAAPPRRVSRKIGPLDLAFGIPETKPQNETTDRPPEDTPGDQLEELGGTTGDTNEDNMDQGPSFLDGIEEPELPPTPTQLGLEKPPGRPKGLMSSSPTARYERKTQRRIDDSLKPSALKLEGLDAGEDSPREGSTADRETLSESELKKQQTKKELFAELRQLKDEIAELEAWTEKLNQPDTELGSAKDRNKLISLLSSENAPHQQSSSPPTNAPISSILSALLPFSSKAPPKPVHEPPSPTNPFALKEHAQAKQYLTVFAPLSLQANSSKVSASKSAPLTESHNLTLSAGPPFPPKLYNVVVNYETNPETQSLISVSVPESGSSNVPDELRRWINTRLSNPLLKLDVSGLCWGINRYWEAAISRAQVWSRVEARHSKLLANRNRRGSNHKSPEKESLSTTDFRHIIPHLDRTSMTFSPKDASNRLRVLISCALTLDEWTSEPRLLPEISISSPSASSKKIEQETKKLFYTLLKGDQVDSDGVGGEIEADAIVRAVDGVLGVLFGLGDTHGKGNSKGKLPVR